MTATLYQLTATAAQMCLPVPDPASAPDGLLDLLDHWQTLIGATTGGLLGVIGAGIVSRSARVREQRIAAGMVLPDLQQLTAAGTSLQVFVEKVPKISVYSPEEHATFRASIAIGKLVQYRPSLFALHTPAIGQLSDIDSRLYSHLFQCQMIHRIFENGLEARRAYQQAIAAAGGTTDVPRTAPSDTRLYEEWQHCVEHATLATYFLNRFVFARLPRWCHGLRMGLFPNDIDERSAALLKSGTLSAPAGSADAAQSATS